MTQKNLTFVIVEKDAFVAHDMQLGLQDASDGCEVLHLRDIADIQHMASVPPRPVFITKLSISQIDEHGLVGFAGPNAAIVLREGVDLAADVAARGWFSLASPFTAEDLTTLVNDIHRAKANV